MSIQEEWKKHQNRVTSCRKCPRLREHCLHIAKVKRKSFMEDKYWGLPVPAFGDESAQIIIIGLAPAAHGANRTGRMFTGDRSGEWLYRALYKAGLATHPVSVSKEDSLKLKNVFITATARCAPPKNKPTPEEIKNCSKFLDWELDHLPNVKVYLCLGKIAWDQTWHILKDRKLIPDRYKKTKFGHGAVAEFNGAAMLGSYHPSQQNTFTGKLTEPMFDAVFKRANELASNISE